ncbi:MAG: hypothetical protein AAF696_31955, partial [Bacteroidota bacterium]
MKLFTYLCSLIWLLSASGLLAQQSYFPKWYYTFDDPANWEVGVDPQDPLAIVPPIDQAGPWTNPPMILPGSNGNHFFSFPENPLGTANPIADINFLRISPLQGSATLSTDQMSIELLMRLNDFRNVAEFRFTQGLIRFYFDKIDIIIYTNAPKTHTIYLDGKERRSIDYYLQNWRHIVLTANIASDEFKLYVDGISPSGFGGSLGAADLSISGLTRINERNAIMDIDEIA